MQCNVQINRTGTGDQQGGNGVGKHAAGQTGARREPDAETGGLQDVGTDTETGGQEVTDTGDHQVTEKGGQEDDILEGPGDGIVRGTEEPQFIKEILSTGRISHGFLVRFDRFDRRTVAKSGLSVFHCNHPKCLSKMMARYSSYENQNNEGPYVESEPAEHMTTSRVIHPIDVGK